MQALIFRLDSNEGERARKTKKTKGTLAIKERELANEAWECIVQVLEFLHYTRS